MSTPSDAIISKWNKSFRQWSENYIKPYKSAILRNCQFKDRELQKGHSSALKDIEKNKGDIASFVIENTEQKYSSLLPSKILQDSYSFNTNEYKRVYQSMLNNFICWKPGTSNALSKSPLEIQYGNNQHFKCKFRKYQLESMKKFIQATPGTKEIRGQWSVNLADDSMMVTFGPQKDIVIIIKIGCFEDKLQIMYQENGILRKNSKIRKQTLKTSCWGLEKTKNSPKFENSIIIQENYSIDISADNVLSISPIKVYVKKTALNQHQNLNRLKIFCGDVCQVINLHKRPYHIEEPHPPKLAHDEEQQLRLKYRNNLLNHSKTKSGTTISKPTPIKSEPTSSRTSRGRGIQRSTTTTSTSTRSQQNPPRVTIDDDGDQDVDAQGWNPTKPNRNHSQQIIDDDSVDDDGHDHGFHPIKPNSQQYRNRIQSSLNRIHKMIPSGAISVASLEDTVVTSTNQEPISSTRNMNNYQSIDPYSTPISTSTYTPQQPQPQPPSVNGYPHQHNTTHSGPTQFRLNDNDTFVVDNTITTQFDNTHNVNVPIIDDNVNWPTFDGINRVQSIGNDHFPMSFDHVFTNPITDDNNAYPPITNNIAIDHNTNNYNSQQFHPQFTSDPNNNHNNPQGPIISDITNTPQDINISEMQELRLQNERLLQRVAEQQRQIEFLAQQIGTMHSQNVSYPTMDDYDYNNNNEYEFDQFQQFNDYQQQQRHHRRNNPLRKRRRISSEALLPPAA